MLRKGMLVQTWQYLKRAWYLRQSSPTQPHFLQSQISPSSTCQAFLVGDLQSFYGYKMICWRYIGATKLFLLMRHNFFPRFLTWIMCNVHALRVGLLLLILRLVLVTSRLRCTRNLSASWSRLEKWNHMSKFITYDVTMAHNQYHWHFNYY